MKELQVSLYDVFGYVAPGALALLGLYFAGWRVILGDHQNWATLTTGGWVGILLASYVMGHSIQAIGNVLTKCLNASPEIKEIKEIQGKSPELITAATKSACRVTELPENTSLSFDVLFEIADNYLLQKGETDCRDIYVYREGFYRGMTVSFVVFAIGSLIRATGNEGSIAIFGVEIFISPVLATIFGIGAVGLAILSFQRYLRFSAYRVRNSIFAFLTIASTTK